MTYRTTRTCEKLNRHHQTKMDHLKKINSVAQDKHRRADNAPYQFVLRAAPMRSYLAPHHHHARTTGRIAWLSIKRISFHARHRILWPPEQSFCNRALFCISAHVRLLISRGERRASPKMRAAACKRAKQWHRARIARHRQRHQHSVNDLL